MMRKSKKCLKNYKKACLIFFLAGLCFLSFSFFKIIKRGIFLPDFVNYYYASGLNLQNNIIPYQTKPPTLYPPTAFIFFKLLSLFPLNTVQLIYTFFSFISLLLSIALMLNILKVKYKQILFYLLAPFFFLSFPAKFTLGMGQINHFLLLLFTLAFYFYKKGQKNKASFCLSLSLSLKLIPALALVFFVIKKDFYFILKTGLFFILNLIISLLFIPSTMIYNYFLKILPGFKGHLFNSNYYNQALTGLLSRFFTNPVLIFYILIIVLILAAIVKTIKPLPDILKYGLLIALGVLLNPVSWQHHLVFLFFPFLAIGFKNLKQKNKFKMIVLFISFLLIASNIKQPSQIGTSFLSQLVLSHQTLGTLLLYLLYLKY